MLGLIKSWRISTWKEKAVDRQRKVAKFAKERILYFWRKRKENFYLARLYGEGKNSVQGNYQRKNLCVSMKRESNSEIAVTRNTINHFPKAIRSNVRYSKCSTIHTSSTLSSVMDISRRYTSVLTASHTRLAKIFVTFSRTRGGHPSGGFS